MERRNAVRPAGRYGGFTLIELTVVMMILVALAGIMVPMFGGMTDRAHDSAAATNVSELVKQIELYNVKTEKGYPDQFDSLISGSTIWAGDGVAKPGISPNAAALMAPHTLAASEAASLNSAGINNLVSMTNATDNATAHKFTLPPTTPNDLVAVATGATVATIVDPTTPGCGLQNADLTNYCYMIVGLGQSCKAVGVVMAAAPIHFDTIDPAVNYQRYGVIFQVPLDGTPHAGAPARLAGVVGVHDAGLSGLDDHINGYNQDVQTGN
jgi:type II secretory pathway pseudopilin PulG